MSKKAQKAYIDFQNSPAGHGHPSSPNISGRLAASELENSRIKIAKLLGAEHSNQIIFTSSCTEACSWAISVIENKKINCPIYYSPFEHPAVKYSIENNKNTKEYIKLPCSNSGIVNYEDAKYLICMQVQNEIGSIQPINQWYGSYIFSDMSQAVGKTDIDLKNIDIATFSGHKFGGSASVGILYLKNPTDWVQFGKGSRYFSDKVGTLDVGAIVATAEALEETLFYAPEKQQKCKEFQSVLEDRLTNMGLEIIGKDVPRVPNTTFVNIPDKALLILMELSQNDIIVGLGSACGSMHSGNSPLMQALGRSGGAHDFIRISQEGYYGRKEALIVVDEISKALRKFNA
jgi:cysteine desulfurase